MTVQEFNTKYFDYLETRHYGLDINNHEVIEYLDNIFQELITIPDFKYMQIKEKFNFTCFYCNGISNDRKIEIENNINLILKPKS